MDYPALNFIYENHYASDSEIHGVQLLWIIEASEE